jgi:hypothetical protein
MVDAGLAKIVEPNENLLILNFLVAFVETLMYRMQCWFPLH